MIGRTFGHYQVIEELGAGGMGVVYRARDQRLNRDVAFKVLPAELAGDAERLARFEREARALAALSHPHIVTIHSVEEAEGVHFLTMELVEGETLDRRIPPGGMSLERFLDVAIPLAEALAAAHDRGVLHRDLKPANVMVTEDGRVKVLDFGRHAKAQANGAYVTGLDYLPARFSIAARLQTESRRPDDPPVHEAGQAQRASSELSRVVSRKRLRIFQR
jgi:serine/threonine protein kinase